MMAVTCEITLLRAEIESLKRELARQTSCAATAPTATGAKRPIPPNALRAPSRQRTGLLLPEEVCDR